MKNKVFTYSVQYSTAKIYSITKQDISYFEKYWTNHSKLKKNKHQDNLIVSWWEVIQTVVDKVIVSNFK